MGISITNSEGEQFTFTLIEDRGFTLDKLGQVFPEAKSMYYTEQGSSNKVVVTAENGTFETPHGGWKKDGRKYFVIQGNASEAAGSSREKKIRDIMKHIRDQKSSRSRSASKGGGTSKGAKKTDSEEKLTRSKMPKIRLGWQHWRHDGFKQVPAKDGGGVRDIEIESFSVNVYEIVRTGERVFFDGGNSCYGKIETMETCLGDFAGKKIEEFSTTGGAPCTFGQYIKDRGLYASKCTMYLMSKVKSEEVEVEDQIDKSETTDTQPQVTSDTSNESRQDKLNTSVIIEHHIGNASAIKSNSRGLPSLPALTLSGLAPQHISITYIKEQESSYSGETSFLKCQSIVDCKEFASLRDPSLNDDNSPYNPLANGFEVCALSVGTKKYLDTIYTDVENRAVAQVCEYPSAKEQVDGLICHHPDEIWGCEGDQMVLGVVSGYHGKGMIQYKWYKDHSMIEDGASGSLLLVNQPGVYHCEVAYGTLKDCSRNVHVVNVSQESMYKCAVPDVNIADLNIDRSAPLGTGSFGTVYKGRWLGSTVAVKAIPLAKRSRENTIKMIEKEVMISSKLRHPNIMQFLALSKEPNAFYLVYEYIDGCNMEELIFDDETRSTMNVTSSKKIKIMTEVAQAIAYMHGLSPMVIHQDIKPSNVMINRSSLVAKVCDFGISRVRSFLAATTTVIGNAGGSPSYMAPECLLGPSKSTAASDVWSLGITFLELLSERDAWGIDGSMTPIEDIKHSMMEKRSPMKPTDAPGLSKELRLMLERCLSFQAVDRPRAIEVLHTLKA